MRKQELEQQPKKEKKKEDEMEVIEDVKMEGKTCGGGDGQIPSYGRPLHLSTCADNSTKTNRTNSHSHGHGQSHINANIHRSMTHVPAKFSEF